MKQTNSFTIHIHVAFCANIRKLLVNSYVIYRLSIIQVYSSACQNDFIVKLETHTTSITFITKQFSVYCVITRVSCLKNLNCAIISVNIFTKMEKVMNGVSKRYILSTGNILNVHDLRKKAGQKPAEEVIIKNF